MMTRRLFPIPTDKILENMALLDLYVKNAYETGIKEHSWEQFVARILIGEIKVWVGINDGKVEGAATTEVIDFLNYRALHLITTSTEFNLSAYPEYHYAIEDEARAVGAKNIQFWGRKGWSKAIDKVTGQHGEKYKEVYRVFSMELNE
jgi:hypothetical protein